MPRGPWRRQHFMPERLRSGSRASGEAARGGSLAWRAAGRCEAWRGSNSRRGGDVPGRSSGGRLPCTLGGVGGFPRVPRVSARRDIGLWYPHTLSLACGGDGRTQGASCLAAVQPWIFAILPPFRRDPHAVDVFLLFDAGLLRPLHVFLEGTIRRLRHAFALTGQRLTAQWTQRHVFVGVLVNYRMSCVHPVAELRNFLQFSLPLAPRRTASLVAVLRLG